MAELESINRLLGDLLDVEDNARKLFKERWELEVGSPGVDRPLTKKSHFKDVVGQKVKARLRLQKKSLLGRLDAVDDDAVIVDGARVPYGELDHAHVVFEFEQKAKPGKGGGAKPHPRAGEATPEKAPKQAKKSKKSKTPPSQES